MASSATISRAVRQRRGAELVTGTKSIVPGCASSAVGRKARDVADAGLASRQPFPFSCLPIPSRSTTPRPVTTTIGTADRITVRCHDFRLLHTNVGTRRLRREPALRHANVPTLVTTICAEGRASAPRTATCRRREQFATPECNRRKRDVHRELRLECMTKMGTGRATQAGLGCRNARSSAVAGRSRSRLKGRRARPSAGERRHKRDSVAVTAPGTRRA